jgi:hypothetical protein
LEGQALEGQALEGQALEGQALEGQTEFPLALEGQTEFPLIQIPQLRKIKFLRCAAVTSEARDLDCSACTSQAEQQRLQLIPAGTRIRATMR